MIKFIKNDIGDIIYLPMPAQKKVVECKIHRIDIHEKYVEFIFGDCGFTFFAWKPRHFSLLFADEASAWEYMKNTEPMSEKEKKENHDYLNKNGIGQFRRIMNQYR